MDASIVNIKQTSQMFSSNGIIYAYKAAGIPMQPDHSGDASILSVAEEQFGSGLGLVQRIDRVVSGCCILSQNRQLTADISRQFREGNIHKYYLAVTAGEPEQESGKLIDFLQEHTNKTRISTGSKGRMAELNYAKIGSLDRYSVFLVELVTGRKHQIRIQMSNAKAPVLGDVRYGARRKLRYPGIFLHALQLQFNHPETGRRIILSAKPPDHPVWTATSQLMKDTRSGLQKGLHGFRQQPDITAACSFAD